ncbi:glucose PTS transporter subunit IIA [Terrilactibacillus laevilacticus]|uniref:Glucose PTS transporter subunit IIA n=1 Tax=Terrilactibacillus laevilacticus TaxID=1380157 RepID=A0ABW5PUN6_9BACI|nr:glucose PTS transporter subunit IIA [Terrilactibacillus laevilacticus]
MPIITSATMIVLAFIFGFVWPSVQHAFALLGTWMYDLGAFGAALYGMLNRLLLPLGLHHVINTLIWFQFGDYHGAHGEITRFFKHDPSAGLFLSGYFPIMMFGLPAACLAMIVAAKPHKRKAITGMLIGIAFTSFLTGVTEPIEYSFMFLSPLLYGIHALLTASSMAVSYLLGIHDGFGFSAGAIDYILNFRIAQKPILLIVQGLIYGGIYFVIFYSLIKRLNLKTPGREDDDDTIENNQRVLETLDSDDKYAVIAAQFIQDLGGVSNITSIDNCTTRLRLTVQDSQLADDHMLKKHGAHGVVKLNKKNIQVIVGTNVEFVADSMKKQLKSPFDLSQVSANLDIQNKPSFLPPKTNLVNVTFSSPLKGNLLNLEEVPDQVFSQKMMGEGFAIDPKNGIVISPINGKVTSVFPTKHAIGLLSDDGLEILIHIGIDTVNLKGEGFTVYVKEGEYITLGDILITFDLEGIKDKVPSVITPIIFTNLSENKHITIEQKEEVDLKEIIQIV